jgi:dephospho-CoA kinase
VKKVAVTGNMGSGKTTVCQIFESMGIPVFYADSEAKSLYSKPDILQKIHRAFGNDVLSNNQEVSFPKMAELVFHNPDQLKKLEIIIHPEVSKLFAKWVQMQHDVPFVIMENAVLFEGSFDKNFDHIIMVTAPEKLRILRVLKRDNCSENDCIRRMQNQWDEVKKVSLSDFIIVNDDSTPIVPRIISILETIKTI